MRFDDDIATDLCTSTQISDDLPTLEELAVLQVILCSLQSYMTNVISNILGGTERYIPTRKIHHLPTICKMLGICSCRGRRKTWILILHHEQSRMGDQELARYVNRARPCMCKGF